MNAEASAGRAAQHFHRVPLDVAPGVCTAAKVAEALHA